MWKCMTYFEMTSVVRSKDCAFFQVSIAGRLKPIRALLEHWKSIRTVKIMSLDILRGSVWEE